MSSVLPILDGDVSTNSRTVTETCAGDVLRFEVLLGACLGDARGSDSGRDPDWGRCQLSEQSEERDGYDFVRGSTVHRHGDRAST
jgi:hypothetical protein